MNGTQIRIAAAMLMVLTLGGARAARAQSAWGQADQWSGRELPPPPGVGHYHGDRWHDGPDGSGERGRDAAVRACARASFDSEKRACMRAVSAAGYLDEHAAGACGGMSFGSNIARCIDAVANKVYVPAEIELCRQNAFDDGKIQCFQEAGRSYAGRPRWERRPDLDGYILEQLRSVRYELQRGNLARALLELGELIDFVEQGSR